MAKLTLHGATPSSVELADGASLVEPCEEAGVHFACGQGFCGTCAFRVLKGGENLSPPTTQERDFFGDEGVKRERLACQCRILSGEVTIEI